MSNAQPAKTRISECHTARIWFPSYTYVISAPRRRSAPDQVFLPFFFSRLPACTHILYSTGKPKLWALCAAEPRLLKLALPKPWIANVASFAREAYRRKLDCRSASDSVRSYCGCTAIWIRLFIRFFYLSNVGSVTREDNLRTIPHLYFFLL